MTESELRRHYEAVYRFILREKRMRGRVLTGAQRERGMVACDEALRHLVAMKDALKEAVTEAVTEAVREAVREAVEPEPVQADLLEMPEPVRYV